MKKTINYLFLFLIIFLISLITILSTIGIETNKFNKIISDKVSQANGINLKLNTVKFKINLRQISLFLETEKPEITYKSIMIPIDNIKAYTDFSSLYKSNLKIKKISLSLEELNISQINKLSLLIKPSNLKSLLNNKIKKGKLLSEIDIFLSDKGSLENFISKGTVKNLEVELFKNVNFKIESLNFFADKKDILIKNIFGELENIKISDGDLKLNLDDGIRLNSGFNSKFDLNENFLKKYSKNFNKLEFFNNIKSVKADLINSLSIDLDHTYKIKDYNFSSTGKIIKGRIKFEDPYKSSFISNDIKEIYFSNFKISTFLKPKNINLKSEGEYSFNNLDFLKINLDKKLRDGKINLKLNFDYKDDLKLNLINYKKSKNSIANIDLDLKTEKKQFRNK